MGGQSAVLVYVRNMVYHALTALEDATKIAANYGNCGKLDAFTICVLVGV